MLKRIATLAVSATAAVALSVMMANPALASDSYHTMYTDDAGTRGGIVTFDESGDVVTLCDRSSDGRYVSLYVTPIQGGHGPGYNITTEGHTNGYCEIARASQGGSHDLHENVTYKFEITLSSNVGYDTASWYNDH